MSSREIVLQISGSLDMENAVEWEARLREAAARAAVVTVRATDLEFIDSTGAGTLLRLTRELSDQGCVLQLTGLQAETREVLEVMGVVPLLNIEPA